MYVNKCIKCGAEFETKNPKRVICPNCLYSDKKYTEELSKEAENITTKSQTNNSAYTFGSDETKEETRYKSSTKKRATGTNAEKIRDIIADIITEEITEIKAAAIKDLIINMVMITGKDRAAVSTTDLTVLTSSAGEKENLKDKNNYW